MRIKNIHIHNFKSIRDITINTLEWTVLLGPNNHGKSNILSAIEFCLSGSAKLDKDDFFAFRQAGDDELWVEVLFGELTDQEKRTFEKYVRSDSTVKIRKFARINSSEAIETGYRGYMEEPTNWWLKNTAFERLGSREKVEAEAVKYSELLELLRDEGRITRQRLDEFQNAYIGQHRGDLEFIETLEEMPLLGTKNVASGILPDFYLVPAVRDLGDETKVKTTTLFGRLLQRTIQSMTETDDRFIDLQNRLSQLIGELNAREIISGESKSYLSQLERDITNELHTWGVNVSIQVEPPEIEKLFELGTQLHLDDGHRTIAERKGHGLQRAVIFALIRTWAKVLRAKSDEGSTSPRRASESIVFAIEEPELFLHPHAQRQLAKDLRDIASTSENQVIICSHSTHFVNLDYYRSIAIVTKNDPRSGTVIRQCNQELFEGEDAEEKKHRFHMASWVNPDRGELFFARKVILVEGETEHAVFPFLASALGCFDPSVSIVDCGCKHNLPLYIRILNAYQICYIVVHDEDPLPDPIPDEWDDDKRREKRRTFELNRTIAALIDQRIGKVFVLSPDFEGASSVSRTQGSKKGKAIVALDHFAALSTDNIPECLQIVVRAAFC